MPSPRFRHTFLLVLCAITWSSLLGGKESADLLVKYEYQKMVCTTLLDLEGFASKPHAKVGLYGG